jgi:hypothetical protein
MLKRLWDTIYPEVAAHFESQFDLDTSIRRLTERSKSSVLRTMFREAAVGRVSSLEVRLRRYNPWFRNDFAPCFVGAFVASGRRPVLRGCFRARTWTRAFLTFWLGLCTLWTIGATAAALADPTVWALPLGGLLMLGFGLGLLFWGKTYGATDITWLSSIIRQSLGSAT